MSRTDPDADPDADPDGPSDAGPFDTPAFRALSEPAMAAIATNPANAESLNDLAVAIATAWLSEPTTEPLEFDPNPVFNDAPDLQQAATKLLELGLAAFPGDRAMAINLAYLRSLEARIDDNGAPLLPDGLAPSVAGLESYWLAHRPTRPPPRCSRTSRS